MTISTVFRLTVMIFAQNLIKHWIATVSWFITKPYLLSYQKKEQAIDIEILIEPALKLRNLSCFDATQCTYYRHIYSCSLQLQPPCITIVCVSTFKA